jgi:hypothetical protein
VSEETFAEGDKTKIATNWGTLQTQGLSKVRLICGLFFYKRKTSPRSKHQIQLFSKKNQNPKTDGPRASVCVGNRDTMFNLNFNTKMKNLFLSAVLSAMGTMAMAQSPVNGFMEGQGNSTTAVSVSSENYTQVFLVPNKVDGVPVFEEITVQSLSVYNSYGVTDRFDINIGVPYIATEGNGNATVLDQLGFKNKRAGVQDLSLYGKVKAHSATIGSVKVDFLFSAGVKTPIGNYKVDEGLQSIVAIGNRATAVTGIASGNFNFGHGFYFTPQIGYSLRSKRVPNAIIGDLKLAYAAKRFYADVYLAGQNSTSGTNILAAGFDGFFPATDVSYNRVGGSVYVPFGGGFGISAGANKIVSGRNVGAGTGYNAGLVYQIR